MNFRSQYNRTRNADDGVNLNRLRQALKGEAYESVKYLFSCPANVPQIIEVLELEYGRPELIIESLIRQNAKNPDLQKPETIVEYARAL